MILGWEQDRNHEYLPVKWFEGGHVPPQLEVINMDFDIEEREDEIDRDSDKDNELSSKQQK